MMRESSGFEWQLGLVDTGPKALESILMGGYITDRTAGGKMVEDLIEAHKRHLPQYV